MVALSLGGCLTNSSEPRWTSHLIAIVLQLPKTAGKSYAVSAKASKLTGIQDERRPDAGGRSCRSVIATKGQTKAIEQAMIDKKCAG